MVKKIVLSCIVLCMLISFVGCTDPNPQKRKPGCPIWEWLFGGCDSVSNERLALIPSFTFFNPETNYFVTNPALMENVF